MDNTIYWLWLSLSCSVASPTFSSLLERFHDAKSVYDAVEFEILDCIDSSNPDRAFLINKDLSRAEEIYEFCKSRGVGILPYSDPRYPRALKQISNPPPVLYYRGILPDFNRGFFVSVVGTRSLSDYGRKNAFKISYDLATAGAVIVSGMAMGIDGVALAGAISSDSPTVAILGSGIDVCYPKQHLTLAREIVKRGCIMTEFPPKTPPIRYNFPKRNRIISGISAATLVIEGRENSGALITARCAREQKRAVYALPANVGSAQAEVSNLLLKNGAKPCTAAEDILSAFEKEYPSVINPFKLTLRCPVDMMYVLRTLEVVANCPNDDIYAPGGRLQKGYNSTKANVTRLPDRKNEESRTAAANVSSEAPVPESARENLTPTAFDKDALKLYKRIPARGGCEIEALVDGKTPLREVMKLLLKLEMGKFVVLLPGDRVERKTK